MKFGPFSRIKLRFNPNENLKPLVSEVLTRHLEKRKAIWTSYFVKYEDVVNDQFGMSCFNWSANGRNYQILRTGCWPYMKYHCSPKEVLDLRLEDNFFKAIKVLNLGLPTLAYGTAARFMISHQEVVPTTRGDVTVYFLYKEDYDAHH